MTRDPSRDPGARSEEAIEGGDPQALLDAGLRAAFDCELSAARSIGESTLTELRPRPSPLAQALLRDPACESSSSGSTLAEIPESTDAAGRYQILGELARGGVGRIVKGRDTDLGRNVAVKLLQERYSSSPTMIRRLLKEAQIGGQLQHPGIVPVYDLGLSEDDRPFFTMKLVQGETLASLLRGRRDPGEDQMRLLRIFEQVCQTMAYAHSRGVIHRDLKADNVMVGAFGEVLVVDWGLAKVLDGGEESRREPDGSSPPDGSQLETLPSTDSVYPSQAGSVMGTYNYMAPEQARGEVDRLDERTDVFGLGALLCEILTNLPPYTGEDLEEVKGLAREARLDACSKRLAESGAGRGLVALAEWCLAPEAQDRPGSAEVVAREIESYLAEVAERSRRAELQAAENQVRAEEAEARARHERRARRLSVTLAATVILAILAGVGGYSWFSINQRERVQRTTQRVNAALAQAHLLREEAQAAGFTDLEAWNRALEKALSARELLRPGEVQAETREQVAALISSTERDVLRAREASARLEADQGVQSQLAAIRSKAGDELDWRTVDEAYRVAFHSYGVDLTVQSEEEAAGLIRKSAVAEDLVWALDEWAIVRKYTGGNRRKLNRVADLADDDPWRAELRRVILEGDRGKILELVRSHHPDELSLGDLNSLGRNLLLLWEFEAAAEVLFTAACLHPDDFWAHYHLGWALGARSRLRVRQPREPQWEAGAGITGANGRAALTVTDRGLVGPDVYETGQLLMNNRFGFDEQAQFGQTFTLPRSITLGSIWVGYNTFVDRTGTYTIELDAGDDGSVELSVADVLLDGADFSGATTDGNSGPFYWMEWDLSSYGLTLPSGMSSYTISCTAQGTQGATSYVFTPCYSMRGDVYGGGTATGRPGGPVNDLGFAVTASVLGPGTQFCAGDGVTPHTSCPDANDNDGSMGGCYWGNPAFPGGGVLTATGSNSISAADTFLHASGVENSFGIFFEGDNATNSGNGAPLMGGLRCAGGNAIRLTPPTPATGHASSTPAPIQSLGSTAVVGSPKRYQYWFRTPTGPGGSGANLTNGYEILWLP